MIREATIHTQPNVDRYLHGGSREDMKPNEDFEHALRALSRFPKLESVKISFTPECMGRQELRWDDYIVEDILRRKDLLSLLFQAIKDRAADKENRTVRKLTIDNLQNCPIPEFTSLNLFRNVMGQLEEFHVSIIQQDSGYRREQENHWIELQTFPSHLCSAWLEPISHRLKALSIYSRSENWGPFPGYFDAIGLSFPKLETLALGNYTLAHDDDLDWILSIKSLKKLIMQNCMIACWVRTESDNIHEWKVRTHDWDRLPEEDDSDYVQFTYGGKWSQCFHRIAGELPNLIDFRFDQAREYSVQYPDRCRVRIFPGRYAGYDDGSLPDFWIDAKDIWCDGNLANVHKEYFEEDQKSLDRLLDKLKWTRV
ncbi:hypothetical protein N0V95_008232 [Ascochyta clinopodiicola]|nr:hypothetical protein N0V95_008232 [Ascochyta clinopodiicola]